MTSSDTFRSVELTKIGAERFKATNARGGETYFGNGGEDPDFTPVEMLLAAIAGCSALDVDAITGKRELADGFRVAASGHKVRDEHGNHLVDITLTFEVSFPEGEGGDAAREMLPKAVDMSRDRLCAVSRTVQLGEPVDYRLA
ncbi:OsmC family protein [Nocardioides coralli]|uniref:OsmC family protein n=1 Tax=Nocardioides coralli TaxID=2872154 RepID=UPI001CA3EAED|nr:OsmC family protein [Nocardioides coralli]QZY27704.1 OsmC family protein [Nocardioides coralli]